MRPVKRALKIAGGGILGLAAAALGLAGYMGQFGDNLREVSPGKFYRSGQMSGDGLRDAARRLGLKSVLNLRGEAASKDWFREESAAVQELGLASHHVRMSAVRLPRPGEVKALIDALERGPYPMIVHCNAGADRSGLASAIYLIVVEKKSVKEAVDAQLTWRYGHLPFGQAAPMDEFFSLYERHGAGKDFQAWALEDYSKFYRPPSP
jgi:protein tyrosine phosphatase (PTP) superfamily phosphohydrolase (DUF442 family)